MNGPTHPCYKVLSSSSLTFIHNKTIKEIAQTTKDVKLNKNVKAATFLIYFRYSTSEHQGFCKKKYAFTVLLTDIPKPATPAIVVKSSQPPTLTTYFPKIHLNVFLSPPPRSSRWSFSKCLQFLSTKQTHVVVWTKLHSFNWTVPPFRVKFHSCLNYNHADGAV
jgi:hypothetical protein